MTDLIPVTLDEIQRLRREGHRVEADKALRAFRESVSNEKKQLFSEINKRNYTIKKFVGVCVIQGCRIESITTTLCQYHRDRQNAYKNACRSRK